MQLTYGILSRPGFLYLENYHVRQVNNLEVKAYRISCLSIIQCPTCPNKESNLEGLSMISSELPMPIVFHHFTLRDSEGSSCSTEDMAVLAAWLSPRAARDVMLIVCF